MRAGGRPKLASVSTTDAPERIGFEPADGPTLVQPNAVGRDGVELIKGSDYSVSAADLSTAAWQRSF